MIITQNQFYREFERICKMSLTHSTCRLAIFVSCFNIDAICSSKMLSEYLKKQFIVFQLIPVVGYIDMKEKFMKLDSDIMNVILIGCGATADLESFLEIDFTEYLSSDMSAEEAQRLLSLGRLDEVKLTRKIYVVDGHRPWNLDNLYGSPMICCLDDNSAAELNTEKEAFYYLINIPEGASADEAESEESQEEVEDLAGDDDEEEEEEEELDLEDSLDRKRNRSEHKESNRKKRKRLIDEHQETLESYYQQGSTISVPSSHQIYDLLSTLGEISIDFLWFAVIGSRSLRDVYHRVYDMVYPGLKNEMQRLQSENDSFSMRNDQASRSNGLNGSASSSSLLDFNVSKRADNTGLQSCKEYTLFLLHHWTLYDAFFYSDYVNSKCHLYSNDGRRLLKTMFARMGISLIQANQNWHYLDLDLKKKLDGLILREVGKFNLTEVIIDGFRRNYGFHGSISSGDYVEAVQALLEHAMPHPYENGKSKPILNNGRKNEGKERRKAGEDGDDGYDENGEDDDDDAGEGENEGGKKHDSGTKNEQFIAGFWRAYDALNSYESVIRGMEIAKFQQQFIFEKGSEIIQKGMVKTQSKFKVVILNESFTTNSSITRSNFNDSTFNKSASSLKDDRVVDIKTFGNGASMFQNPLILTKLGNWILNVQADLDEGLLPLLIGAYNSETSTYLICGLPSRTSFDDEDEEDEDSDESDAVDTEDSDGDERRQSAKRGKTKHSKRRKQSKNNKVKQQKVILNAFSVLFEKVTQEISIQARMDSFQSAIIELRKEDLTKFLDGLTRYSQYML